MYTEDIEQIIDKIENIINDMSIVTSCNLGRAGIALHEAREYFEKELSQDQRMLVKRLIMRLHTYMTFDNVRKLKDDAKIKELEKQLGIEWLTLRTQEPS